MPLRPARAARVGVIGAPVARTAAVVGTAAVVSHGVDRRQDRREGPAGRPGKTDEIADPRQAKSEQGPEPAAGV